MTGESVVFFFGHKSREYSQKTLRDRVMAGGKARKVQNNAVNADATPNVEIPIYIKPNALFGIFLMLFLLAVVLIWYNCMNSVNAPYILNRNNLKFGKEM